MLSLQSSDDGGRFLKLRSGSSPKKNFSALTRQLSATYVAASGIIYNAVVR
jgi:hypothetical protein